MITLMETATRELTALSTRSVAVRTTNKVI